MENLPSARNMRKSNINFERNSRAIERKKARIVQHIEMIRRYSMIQICRVLFGEWEPLFFFGARKPDGGVHIYAVNHSVPFN